MFRFARSLRWAASGILGAGFVAPSAIATAQAPTSGARLESHADPRDVATIDALLASLYRAISGPAGPRDWAKFSALFLPGARLGDTRLANGVPRVRMFTVDEYTAAVTPQLQAAPFYEREASRHVDQYGMIAQVFSTYESRRAETDSLPFSRGINTLQLFYDHDRWWILGIAWDAERSGNAIPAEYLKRPNGK